MANNVAPQLSGDANTTMAAVPVEDYLVSGAITLTAGIAYLTKAGVGVMTLADPVEDGLILTITSTTAQAHTVTAATGINDLGASGDVGTYGGAKGDGMTLTSRSGQWYVLANQNVTIA